MSPGQSIYQRALGAEFDRLHPRMQERFGFSSSDRIAQIGTGTMENIWRGRGYTLPFLALGAWRRIMFPTRGSNIDFTISNYAYVDAFGRETVTWSRRFELSGKIRKFDATMIYSEARGQIVDYLGSHQHLAVDIALTVDADGGLRLRSTEQRFYERWIAFRFPMALSGYAEVREWWDEASERYQIEVAVTNPRWGPLFGYRGSFDVEERLIPNQAAIPTDVLPVREERRE